MKRDVMAAILAGFLLGGIVAVTITNLPNLIKIKQSPLSKESQLPTATPIISPKSLPAYQIEVTAPDDQSIAEESVLEILGKGKPESVFLIETAGEMKTTISDKNGAFKEKINLTDGQNDIYISSYDENGESATGNLTVYYTKEKL